MIGSPGPFWSAQERVNIVQERRASLDCEFCNERLQALSPYSVTGVHTSVTSLAPSVVEVVHRIGSDPARLTKAMFDEFVDAGHSAERYVEIVGVIAASVIVDTMHYGLGLLPPDIDVYADRAATGQESPFVVDDGAWVPLSGADRRLNEVGIPRTANIRRAMGSVPNAVQTFYTAFAPHYTLQNLPLDLSQSQAEFMAARVSALNQCFY